MRKNSNHVEDAVSNQPTPSPAFPPRGEGADGASASDAAQTRANAPSPASRGKAGKGERPVRAAAKNKAEKS